MAGEIRADGKREFSLNASGDSRRGKLPLLFDKGAKSMIVKGKKTLSGFQKRSCR
jgi:hypothetical protein